MGHLCRIERQGPRESYPTEFHASLESGNRVVVPADLVARLAYSFWEARGRIGGSAVEDWLRAERELPAS